MMQTVAAESQSQALSVDGAAPRDGDVVRTVGHEQCHIGVVLPHIGCLFFIRFPVHIVERVRAAQ